MKGQETTTDRRPPPALAGGGWLVTSALAWAGPLLRVLALALAATGVSLYRTPLLAAVRGWVLAVLVVAGLLGMIAEGRAWAWARGRGRRVGAAAAGGLAVLWGAVLAVTIGCELQHEAARRSALGGVLEARAAVGERFIVGYRDFAEIRRLVEQDGIGGIYVTRRNLSEGAGRLAAELAELQAIRRARGRAPLLVAADHEGGVVSHLAPPLTKLPGLGAVGERAEGEREAAAREQARTQGAELRRLGVNLNFAPVVDLRVDVAREEDRLSRIDARAISRDPAVVEAVARWYCEGLRAERVACTLKHFPGLGRVREDTHFVAGRLEAGVEVLAAEDWAPFRAVATGGGPSTLIMVGHTVVEAIDAERPASRSRAVVGGVIREGWGHEGALVTDDLSMFPTSRGPGGIGGACMDAVQAGVDYLLISYDPDLYYEAAAALLGRWHEVPAEVEAASARRRAALVEWLAAG